MAFAVKTVEFSHCTFSCTDVFTYDLRKLLTCWRMQTSHPESVRAETTKKGGSDPTFWVLSRPKGLLGSLPPFFELKK